MRILSISSPQELNNAKMKIHKLSDDLRNNHKRLFVKAVCPPDQNVATTTGLDAIRFTELVTNAG